MIKLKHSQSRAPASSFSSPSGPDAAMHAAFFGMLSSAALVSLARLAGGEDFFFFFGKNPAGEIFLKRRSRCTVVPDHQILQILIGWPAASCASWHMHAVLHALSHACSESSSGSTWSPIKINVPIKALTVASCTYST